MNSNKQKIGIFGIGAIGSVMACCLQDKHQVYFFNRSLKKRIDLIIEKETFSKQIQLSKASEKINLDWLLICIKEYHYLAAAPELAALITPSTRVGIIRNGLYLKEPLLAYASKEQLVEVMIDCPTQLIEDGKFHALRKPKLKLEGGALATSLHQLFNPNLIQLRQVDNFITASWEKLIESSALGAILALSGESVWIFKDNAIIKLFEQLVDEGIAVAYVDGAKLSATFKKDLLEKLAKYPDHKESSMLTDRRLGRPIEVNAKNGIISRLGKVYGLATPLNDWATHLLKYTNTRRIGN